MQYCIIEKPCYETPSALLSSDCPSLPSSLRIPVSHFLIFSFSVGIESADGWMGAREEAALRALGAGVGLVGIAVRWVHRRRREV